ncbi:hypothetical protein RJT34_16874 [Clitoria ternatea]|uniref:F-box domain-containing protein n=1 Tax=Clitoria ternatea TaxID=43366 RepID=A0AAN9PD82_CLITE
MENKKCCSVPDEVLIEILVRAGVREWPQIACVNKHCSSLLRSDCFWQAALSYYFPFSQPQTQTQTNIRSRFMALYIGHHMFGEDEIVGHCYLLLKQQLQLSVHSGILHGVIIDQLIACGKSGDEAHQVASRIWVAVLDNLEENHHTFCLLKRLAQEGDVFLPYPYARSVKVQWRVFEKLFTDFRDCFINHVDYYDILACAKSMFHPIPSPWLGF